jgi:hypothetical protein
MLGHFFSVLLPVDGLRRRCSKHLGTLWSSSKGAISSAVGTAIQEIVLTDAR